MGHVIEYNSDPDFQFKFFQEVPKVIIQYGPPRSATTLQFHAVCAMMVSMYPGQVECKSVIDERNITYALMDNDSDAEKKHRKKSHATSDEEVWEHVWKSGKRYKVIKVHDHASVEHLVKSISRLWLFVTSYNDLDAAGIAEGMKVEPKYIQSFPLVKSRGWEIVADYTAVFQSSEEQTKDFLKYMKHWSLLRQCCGAQQSESHRKVLWGEMESSEYPACHDQDLDAVEHELINTGTFQQMHKDNIVEDWVQPDSHFDGTYCTWFNRQVKCKHLIFNQLPSKPFC